MRTPLSSRRLWGTTLATILFPLICSPLTSFAQTPAASGSVITIAGTGSFGYSGDNGPALSAEFGLAIVGMAIGPDGALYLADTDNYCIRVIDPATGIIRTVAGNGVQDAEGSGSGDGGQATHASFSSVYGIAVDRVRGILYLADYGNNRVRQVNVATGVISHCAGLGLFNFNYSGDGGPATTAEFAATLGLAVDDAGRVLIVDDNNYRVRQINPASGVLSTLAGTAQLFAPDGDCSTNGNGGPAANASLGYTQYVASDGAGNAYVIDNGRSWCPNFDHVQIRRVDTSTGIITKVAGGGTITPPEDGLASDMNLAGCDAIAVDNTGNVFFARHTRVFKLTLATGMVSVFAGDGVAGYSGDGGPASTAQFARIYGLYVPPGGGLVIADNGNGRIRYVAPDSINLTGDSAQTAFHLPWVSSLSGDLNISNNPNLATIDAGELTGVGGVVSLSNNTSASEVDLGLLVSAGSVCITGNAAADTISLGSLDTVVGEVTIGGNTGAATVDLGSLTNLGGALSLTDNTSAGEVDLGLLVSAGSVCITGNTASDTISLGSLDTVVGEVTISDNSSAATVALGSLADVGGDVTIESNAPNAVVNLTSLDSYGCGPTAVTMKLNGGTIQMPLTGLLLCPNATLTGSTTLEGSVTNRGRIKPGSSPGRLDITGNLTLDGQSRLSMECGGFAATRFDVIAAGGNVVLGGTLSVSLLTPFPGAVPAGTSLTVLSAGSPLTGAFSNAASGAALTTADGYARFTVLYAGEDTVRLTDIVIVDGDSDTIPDWWEDYFGLNKANAADALLDADSDGASNVQEWLAETDPGDPDSLLRLESIARNLAGVTVTVSTSALRHYTLERGTDLAAPFESLETKPGTGGDVVFTDPAPTNPRGFYLVRVRIPVQ